MDKVPQQDHLSPEFQEAYRKAQSIAIDRMLFENYKRFRGAVHQAEIAFCIKESVVPHESPPPTFEEFYDALVEQRSHDPIGFLEMIETWRIGFVRYKSKQEKECIEFADQLFRLLDATEDPPVDE